MTGFTFENDRPLRKVVSGGQIGADIAGLRAGRRIGLETGGFIPAGFRTKVGNIPELGEQYGLVETMSPSYPRRTWLNAESATATIRLAINFDSPGENLTLKYCKELNKPVHDIQLARLHTEDDKIKAINELVNFIRLHQVEILNVAGNGLREIEKLVEEILFETFKHVKIVV